MPQVKPTVTACGMCLISEPSRSRPTSVKHKPRQQNGEQQAVEANLRFRRRHEHDERAGGATNLKAAATQGRDAEAAHTRRVKAASR